MIPVSDGPAKGMVDGDVKLSNAPSAVKQTGVMPLEPVNRNDENVKNEHFNSSVNENISIDLNKLDNFIPSNLKFDHNIQAQSLIHSQQQVAQQSQHVNMMNQSVPVGMPGYGVFQQGMPDFSMLSRSISHGSKDLQVPLQPEHFPQQSLISQLSNTIPHLSTFMPQAHVHSSSEVKEEPGPEIPFLEYSGGVVYDNGAMSQGGRWLTFWQHRNRLWRKAFSVALYGYEGAKELAESFWISKMRAIQLYNRTKQHKLLLPDSSRRRTEQPRSSRTKVKKIQLSPPLRYHTSVDIANTAEKVAVTHDDADVFWEEETQSWCFERLNRKSNELEVAKFTTEGAEKNEVRSEAIKQKTAHYQELLKEYGESGYPGLTYERTRCCWRIAHLVPSKGIKRNKYFNISRYGYKLAKELAVQYKEAVDQLQGEEPTNWNGEIVPSQEFMNDPVTVYFHHVLNSFRSRESKYKPDSIIGFSQVVNSVMDAEYYDTPY